MNTLMKRKTLADSLRIVNDSDGFHYAIANFLDRFKNDQTVEMVSKESPAPREILSDHGFADTYAAATAGDLCQLQSIPSPSWVNQNSRRMECPWFAAKSQNLGMILLQESPAAFCVCNLFVSANALSRA
jgi:hypothetical protein